MMSNMFSIFDPMSSTLNFSINWISTILGMLFLPQLYWLISSRMNILYYKFMNNINVELKILMGKKNSSNWISKKFYNGATLIFTSLFLFIMFNNFLGLFPYIFTSTSHLTLTLTLAFPLWLSFMLYGWINNMNHMFTHLVPQNTPNILMPFMVLIESISNLIRALTLSVRLTANMIAGHLLITLLSSTCISMSNIFVPMVIFTQILLMTLESAVAIIQSYVFMVLTTLYSSEVN